VCSSILLSCVLFFYFPLKCVFSGWCLVLVICSLVASCVWAASLRQLVLEQHKPNMFVLLKYKIWNKQNHNLSCFNFQALKEDGTTDNSELNANKFSADIIHSADIRTYKCRR
jgi:hypothetical protein